MLVNGYKRLRALSKPEQRTLRDMFPPMCSARASTIAGQILSGLLRIPVWTIENVVAQVLKHGPQPRVVHRIHSASAQPPQVPPGTSGPVGVTSDVPTAPTPQGGGPFTAKPHPPAETGSTLQCAQLACATVCTKKPGPDIPAGFVNVVRVTQFMSSYGLPKALLPNLLYLIMAAKGDIGNCQHNRRFCSVAEAAADKLLLQGTVSCLNEPLPGTGRPPDVELFADGGSVGKYYSRSRDQLLVVGVAMSTPQWPYTASTLIACVNEQADGRAPAVRKHLEAAFDLLGAGSFDKWLAERFSVSVGDQALAPGGEWVLTICGWTCLQQHGFRRMDGRAYL